MCRVAFLCGLPQPPGGHDHATCSFVGEVFKPGSCCYCRERERSASRKANCKLPLNKRGRRVPKGKPGQRADAAFGSRFPDRSLLSCPLGCIIEILSGQQTVRAGGNALLPITPQPITQRARRPLNRASPRCRWPLHPTGAGHAQTIQTVANWFVSVWAWLSLSFLIYLSIYLSQGQLSNRPVVSRSGHWRGLPPITAHCVPISQHGN